MPTLGMGEAVIILMVILLIFGPSKLPELAKSVGTAMKQFRQASREALQDDTSVVATVDSKKVSPSEEGQSHATTTPLV
ncbi:MAG: twin-arginine translocase TatA/TatE family subunit [Vampirovibrionales bacterium]